MSKKLLFLSCIIALLAISNAWAADKNWTNGAGDRLWRTSSNWSGGTPTSADKAAVRNNYATTGPIIDSSTTAVANTVVIGDWSSTGGDSLNMTGGSLTTNSWFVLGYGPLTNRGTFTISAGTVNVNDPTGGMYVGNTGTSIGTLNMTGGTINVTATFGIAQVNGSTGTVNLNGGTINCGALNMTTNGRLDITTGTLIINSNMDSTIGTYIANTWITASGGGTIRHDYNITNPGKTTVWVSFGPTKAANPNPANNAVSVMPNAQLSWTAGSGTPSHNVYFGTTSPGTLQTNQTATTFNPGSLAFNTTYYWRIDEVNGPNTVTGDVWSFTTISGQAKNPDPANSAANVASNKILGWTSGPGAVSHDVYFGTVLNDVNTASRLLGDLNGNGIVNLDDMSILSQYWLLDPAGTEPYAGVNTDNVVDFVDYALLAQDWMNSAGLVFRGNQDANSFSPDTLALNTTYYWRIDEVNGPNTITGNIWSFSTQTGKAYNPNPSNGISGVAVSATLSWSAGAGATSHNVYFGTANPPPSIGNQPGTTYNPGTLAFSTTYYWQIDEISGSDTAQGDLWSFTTSGAVNANIRKGPYLIYPNNNTQMTVLWQVDVTAGCSIAWGTDTTYSTGSAGTTEYGSDHQHKYNITGLTPGTKYYYRVTAGSNNWTGNFYAAPAADATDLKFFMYGDTRSYGASHNAVAGQMVSTYTADPNYQTMVLHAGDWVSADGENEWTSQWYNYTWTNIVNIAANMPLMGTIGNHEGGASIFRKYRPFPFQSADYFSFDYGPVHVAVLDQYNAGGYAVGSTQYNWLHNDLATTTKLWKIIVLHMPGWACAGGHPNEVPVQDYIQPLCVDHGVQIVLAGHVHYYSRAVVNGVQHVTSGGGGADLYTPLADQPNVVTYTKSLDVVKVAISGNTLTGTAISSTGTVLDTFTAAQPKATNPSPANSAASVAVTPTLSWMAGGNATSHNVYFGTANPPPSIGNQTGTAYSPGTLAFSTTYYWRIDEVSGSGTTTGDLWSFTTVASGPEFTFVQASDPQMGWTQCGNMDYLWGTTIGKINIINPAFVILTGDLITSNSNMTQTATYKSYAAGINPGIPIYTVPGNHDIGDPSGSTSYAWWLSNLAYPTGYANPWYSFTYGDSIFIGLDSGVFKADWGGKQAAEIAWLTQTLQDANDAGYTHKFVFMHVALFVASADEAYNSAGNLPLAIRGQLLSLFHQYGVKVVMAGHRHTNNDAVDGDLQMFTTTSCTCGLGVPPTTPGVRIFKVYSDHVEQEVRTLDSIVP